MSLMEARRALQERIFSDEMIAVECNATGLMIATVYLGKQDFDVLEPGYAKLPQDA